MIEYVVIYIYIYNDYDIKTIYYNSVLLFDCRNKIE